MIFPETLRTGDRLRATGDMTARHGGRILAGHELVVITAVGGMTVLRDVTTGQHYTLTEPEVRHGAHGAQLERVTT